MELKPRFTNKVIRQVFDAHQIDLTNLDGTILLDYTKRMQMTIAGMPGSDSAEVQEACDALTPGEHVQILQEAIEEAWTRPNQREAVAKAAAEDKSE